MSDEMTIDFTEAENAFGFAIREMARLSELPMRKIITAEAGSVLKYCAGATKQKTPDQVTPKARAQAIRHLELNRGDLTINSGLRHPNAVGRIWKRSTGPRANGFFRAAYGAGVPIGNPVNYHWKNSDWIDIQEAIFDYQRIVGLYMANAVKSIGLARQSWIQVADSLGIRLELVKGGHLSSAAIAQARTATSSYGKIERNGFSNWQETPDSCYAELINRLPYAGRAGMADTLYRAIYGRIRYFEENVSLGVFQAMQKVANRYPGFEVKPGKN